MPEDNVFDDVEQSLNELYREFQDEYVKNPTSGQVSVVSHSHIVCNGKKGKRIVTVPELYLLEGPHMKELRMFINLLPSTAKFYILHYPEMYDVFVIDWNNKDVEEESIPSTSSSNTKNTNVNNMNTRKWKW
jgi:hypothetical protein